MVRQIIKTQTDGFRKRTTNKLNWRKQLQRTKKWPLNNTKQQQQKKNKKQTDKQNKTKKTKQILKKDNNKKETNRKNTHTQKQKYK